MLETAERGPLDRRARRIPRVDLDDPAEAVGLVAVGGEVEALVGDVPAVTETRGGESVARFMRRRGQGRAGAKIAVEVLLTGEIGAPRGVAVGTVVQGAEDFHAARIGGSPHQRMARGRTGDAARRVAGDPPVEAGRAPHFPAAVARRLHVNDVDAVAGLLRAHHVAGDRSGRIVRRRGDVMDERRIDVFAVRDEQPPRVVAPGGRKEMHAVGVRAVAVQLRRLVHRAARIPVRRVREGVAPRDQHPGGVAVRHAHRITHRGDVRWHGGEADSASRRGRGLRMVRQAVDDGAAEQRRGGDPGGRTERAAQEAPPRELPLFDEVEDRRIP